MLEAVSSVASETLSKITAVNKHSFCLEEVGISTLRRVAEDDVEVQRYVLLSTLVCPQFETTKSVVLTACQKKHRGPHKPQNQDASHGLLHAGGACRRAIACKFPPLTFETPEGYAVHPSDCPNRVRKNTQHSRSQPKKGTAAKANTQANSLENCRETPLLPVEPEVSSPPDVETPPVPSVRNRTRSSTLPPSSRRAWHPEKDLAFGIDPCGSGESGAVLVIDTPEHEYGP
ncbi:RAD9, HUS1, RAD1-interacting nuclear orphan protein 1 [Morphnus guianensis]